MFFEVRKHREERSDERSKQGIVSVKREVQFAEITLFVTVNGEDKRLNYGSLELTEDGVYEVAVTDKIGNMAEYSFTIEKTIGAGTIIDIILACLAVVGVVVVIILKKKEIF